MPHPAISETLPRVVHPPLSLAALSMLKSHSYCEMHTEVFVENRTHPRGRHETALPPNSLSQRTDLFHKHRRTANFACVTLIIAELNFFFFFTFKAVRRFSY